MPNATTMMMLLSVAQLLTWTCTAWRISHDQGAQSIRYTFDEMGSNRNASSFTSWDLQDQDASTVPRGLFSRGSSATFNPLSVFIGIDGATDGPNISIGQGHLSSGLTRRASSARITDTQSRPVGNGIVASGTLAQVTGTFGADGQGHSRGGTSNTWTSSSGGALDELEDVEEDRTGFVNEYNRIARKVSLHVLHLTTC